MKFYIFFFCCNEFQSHWLSYSEFVGPNENAIFRRVKNTRIHVRTGSKPVHFSLDQLWLGRRLPPNHSHPYVLWMSWDYFYVDLCGYYMLLYFKSLVVSSKLIYCLECVYSSSCMNFELLTVHPPHPCITGTSFNDLRHQ